MEDIYSYNSWKSDKLKNKFQDDEGDVMLKVLMVEHFLPGNPYTKDLAKGLENLIDLTILTKRNYVDDHSVKCKIKSCLLRQNVRNKLLSLALIVNGWMHILYEVLFGGYDIIHVHTFKVDYIEMALYRLFAKKKLVHTIHNILPHEATNGAATRYKKFYNCCQLIIVHNEYCRKLLVRDYGISNDKIVTIPYGTYFVNRTEHQKREDRLEFLTVGMIRKYKGIDILIKGIANIPENLRKRMHFTIVGDQPLKLDNTDYQALIDNLGISDVVTFSPKRVSDESLSELFADADVCIYSYREIYGSSALLMAYSYEKPVIVSDVPTFIEETGGGKTGLLFRNEDPVDLADKIVQFSQLSTADIDEYVNNIRILVNEKYNWNLSAKKTVKAYERVVKAIE